MDECRSPANAAHTRRRVARRGATLESPGTTNLALRSTPADTTVAIGKHILGKQRGPARGRAACWAVSGGKHRVLTAVAASTSRSSNAVSEVEFKPLAADEIRQYIATGECDDKAGGYAIQGRAAQFVVELRGSFSGVMGLPLYETAQLLERMGAQRERRNTR